MKDALGNGLVEGQLYGYCQNQNGHTTVTTGVYAGSTPKGYARIRPEREGRTLYLGEMKLFPVRNDRPRHTKPAHLFPIHEHAKDGQQ